MNVRFKTTQGEVSECPIEDLKGRVFYRRHSYHDKITKPFIIEDLDEPRSEIILRSTIQEDGSLIPEKRRVRCSSLKDGTYLLVSSRFMDERYIAFCKATLEGKFLKQVPLLPSVQTSIKFIPPPDVPFESFLRYYKKAFPSLSERVLVEMWDDYIRITARNLQEADSPEAIVDAILKTDTAEKLLSRGTRA